MFPRVLQVLMYIVWTVDTISALSGVGVGVGGGVVCVCVCVCVWGGGGGGGLERRRWGVVWVGGVGGGGLWTDTGRVYPHPSSGFFTNRFTKIRTWISNFHVWFKWEVIIHPCPNFSGSLTQQPLNFGHG